MAGRPKRRARLAEEAAAAAMASAQATQWFASTRFLKSYKDASPALRHHAEREVRELRVRAGSMSTWTQAYKCLQGVPGQQILELELGGAPRALALVGDASVAMVAMGNHEITRDYVKGGWIKHDLNSLVDLPDSFRPGHASRLFPATEATGKVFGYGNETEPEWLYWLDEEQAELTDRLVDSCEELLLTEDYYKVHFVLGGPGTGKTSILLQLLLRLSDSVIPNAEDWPVALQISDELAHYISTSTGWDLTESRELAGNLEHADIVLIDDPSDSQLIRQAAELARQGLVKVVIVGFDPLQLGDSIDDADYENLLATYEAEEHTMSSCYRQKEEVGEAAVRVADAVAASSPFLDEGKKRRYSEERQRLTSLANQVVFQNPSGLAVTYENAKAQDWTKHVAWIRKQPGLWRHWPPVLLVQDSEAESAPADISGLDHLRYDTVALEDVHKIKGLEYQHVLLNLAPQRYRALQNGFTGTGRRLYNEYRLIRIPFSRAKDSLAVFVA